MADEEAAGLSIGDRAVQHTTEALEEARLAWAIGLPDDPALMVDALRQVRAHHVRLEQLNVQMIDLRGRARREAKRLEAAHEDAWADAVAGTRRPAMLRLQEPAYGERKVSYDLATMDEKRALREAERVVSVVDDAYEMVRSFMFSVRSHREDIHEAIRAVSLDRRYES